MRRRVRAPVALALMGATAMAFTTIDFGSEPARWANAECRVYYDPSWSAFPSYVSELSAAMSPWTAVSGSNFRFFAGGSSPSTNLLSTNNGNNDSYFDTSLSPSIYAVTYVPMQGATLSDRDVAFNSNWNWDTSGSGGVDFRSVAIHEFGHVLGLGHETANPAVMRPYYDGSSLEHTLYFDDAEGCRFIYPEPPPPPPPTNDSDVAITNVEFSPLDAGPGDRISATFTMSNLGQDPTGAFAATVYLVDDGDVSPDDRYLGARGQSSLDPGQSRSGFVSVRLPDILTPRAHHIGVILDAQEATGDRNRANNRGIAADIVRGGGDALAVGLGYRVTGKLEPFGRESFSLELSAGTRLNLRAAIEGGSLGLTLTKAADQDVLMTKQRFERVGVKVTVPEDGTYIVTIDSENRTASDYEFRAGAKTIRLKGTLTVGGANQILFPGYVGSTVGAKIRSRSDARPTVEWAGIVAPRKTNRRGTRVRLGEARLGTTGPVVLALGRGDGPDGEVSYSIRMRVPKDGLLIRR